MDEMEKYLRPTPTFDCDNEAIKQKAGDLTEGDEKVADKAKSLFYFVRDEIKYNMYAPLDALELYRASRTLERGDGNCIQKAVLLVALARAAGIPARLRHADFRNHHLTDEVMLLLGTNVFMYHGYSDLYIEGKWVRATPALDLKTCQENRFIPVEFDAKRDAIFHSHDLDGKPHIEYIRDHGYYDDVPLDEMTAAWKQLYGPESIDVLNYFIELEKAQ